MLVQTVLKYLESHKRLVIPQLGAFIVKEPGCVLFSELLKRDDGVLRALLMQAGMSDLEAAGEIDRFVFEIRHAIERGVGAPLGGLGLMKPGPNGTIAFDFNPQQEAPTIVVRKRKASEKPAIKESAPEGSAVDAPEGSGPRAAGGSLTSPAEDSGAESAVADSCSPKLPHATPVNASRVGKSVLAEPNLSRSVKLNPEPYVKGLRYGKPHKNTNAYTYVGHGTRRWSIDRFLLVAIAAAVVAVAAIAFGYLRKSREEKSAIPATEQVQTDPAQAEQPTPKR